MAYMMGMAVTEEEMAAIMGKSLEDYRAWLHAITIPTYKPADAEGAPIVDGLAANRESA